MGLDKIIHEQSRLKILTLLAGSDQKETGFTELQTRLELSSGNLSVQLKKLSEAGYVAIKKSFKDNKPYTGVSISRKGLAALEGYVDEMEGPIRELRK